MKNVYLAMPMVLHREIKQINKVKEGHNIMKHLPTCYTCFCNHYCYYLYHIAGLFCPAKLSIFSFSKLQKQKLNARSRSIRVGVTVHRICQNENKTDEARFSSKARKFGHTKQTCYTVCRFARNSMHIRMA